MENDGSRRSEEWVTSLPPFISLRGLAVELCPIGRPLNDFKQQLRRIMDEAGIERHRMPGYKRMGRYLRGDLERLAPWLIEAWVHARKQRLSDL